LLSVPAASIAPNSEERNPIIEQLTPLTAEHRDRIPSFVREWIDDACCTTPLTDNEWQAWEAGVQHCYAASGHRWPGVVVRVGSPMIGTLAAPIAVRVLRRLRRDGACDSARIDAAVATSSRQAVGPEFRPAVCAAASAAVRAALDAAPPGAGHPQAGARDPWWVELRYDAAVREGLRTAVHKRVHKAVFRDVCLPLLFAVDHPIDSMVELIIDESVPVRWKRGRMVRPYGWSAFAAFFRDEVKPSLDDHLWCYSRSSQDTQLTRWWWPTPDFVMACDRPAELHIEHTAGFYRLHHDSGPAIRWADGWAIHFWHGTRVPAHLIETGWDAARILAEPNTAIRRCAIELLGWDRFVEDAGFRLRDAAPDPANPGQWLRLYDVPRTVLTQRARVLLCTNATRERDGTRRSFGLTVPTDCRSALTAAAWTFDIPEADYTNLARAT
jgi:hypothetical protein